MKCVNYIREMVRCVYYNRTTNIDFVELTHVELNTVLSHLGSSIHKAFGIKKTIIYFLNVNSKRHSTLIFPRNTYIPVTWFKKKYAFVINGIFC